MRIKTMESEIGGLVLSVRSEDENTHTYTRISSTLSGKVENKIVKELQDVVAEVGRYNNLSDVEIAKNFVESLLTEKEIRELIKSLKN